MKIKNLRADIGIFILFTLCLSAPILFQNLSVMDELWNFSFAKNIVDGLIPYKEYNMLQTPLAPYIASVFLHIFGSELIIMRILCLINIVLIFFIAYKILAKLKCNKIISCTMMIFMAMFYCFATSLIYDYNNLTLLFLLIILYLEIENNFLSKEKEVLTYFFIGILAALAFLSKQSTGLMIIVSVMVNCLFHKKWLTFKWKLIGVLLPLILFFAWLLINNNLYYFWEYTIAGIPSFMNNSVPYWNFIFMGITNTIIGLAIPLFLIIAVIYTVKNKDDSQLNIRKTISICCAGMTIAYPIADPHHVYIGAFPIIFLFYMIIKGKVKIKIPSYSWVCIGIAVCFFLSYSFWQFKSEPSGIVFSKLNHFKYIRISDPLQDEIILINDFIIEEKKNGNEVYIIDSNATLYKLPIDYYHANYDLFLYGNIGLKSPIQFIREINKENTVILMLGDVDPLNWQFPIEVVEEVKNSFYKINHVGGFSVYKK